MSYSRVKTVILCTCCAKRFYQYAANKAGFVKTVAVLCHQVFLQYFILETCLISLPRIALYRKYRRKARHNSFICLPKTMPTDFMPVLLSMPS